MKKEGRREEKWEKGKKDERKKKKKENKEKKIVSGRIIKKIIEINL